jgi:hypothetical protein
MRLMHTLLLFETPDYQHEQPGDHKLRVLSGYTQLLQHHVHRRAAQQRTASAGHVRCSYSATDSRTARPYLLRTFFHIAEEVMYYYVKKLMYTCVSTHPVLRDSADRK